MFEGSFERFHAQIVVDFEKCCVRVKNVAIYVDFVDFFVVVEHLIFVISLAFSLERISSRRTSKLFWSNLLLLTSRFSRVFDISFKTNERGSVLFAKLDVSRVKDF